MYKTKYFSLKELLPKSLHNLPAWIGWRFFDDRILMLADFIREKYGVCTINGYGLDGCGLRTNRPDDSVSQHYFGRALDIHILYIEKQNLKKEDKIKAYNVVRDELSKLPEFKNIRFEYEITWLHIDCGNSDIKKFNPRIKKSGITYNVTSM